MSGVLLRGGLQGVRAALNNPAVRDFGKQVGKRFASELAKAGAAELGDRLGGRGSGEGADRPAPQAEPGPKTSAAVLCHTLKLGPARLELRVSASPKRATPDTAPNPPALGRSIVDAALSSDPFGAGEIRDAGVPSPRGR